MSAARARARQHTHKRITQHFHFLSAVTQQKVFCAAHFNVSMEAKRALGFYAEFCCSSLSALLSKCNLHIILCTDTHAGGVKGAKWKVPFCSDGLGERERARIFMRSSVRRIVFRRSKMRPLHLYQGGFCCEFRIVHESRMWGRRRGPSLQSRCNYGRNLYLKVWSYVPCTWSSALCCRDGGVARRAGYSAHAPNVSPLDRGAFSNAQVMSRTCTRSAHRLLTETQSREMRRRRE